MLISYLWLKELVEFDMTPEELAVTLTGLGLETTIRSDRRGWYGGIVVGRVLEKEKHPNADKLSLTKVDVGNGQIKSIVCGAPNVAAGQLVPVALIGAVLPDGMKIEKRKVRGELSEGMICSENELQLSEEHNGIMVLDEEVKPGDIFAEKYEVCDVALEADLTPNRGDCLSMMGIAREVAAAAKTTIRRPAVNIAESDDDSSKYIKVEIAAPDLCPRYAGRMIRGVKSAPSPFWMRRRLLSVGVRSINNLVDVTNYVLMETGHPLHAFDYRNVEGAKITVRRAADGETFTTLDGKTHKLSQANLVIADAAKAVALAGIMGGQNSEVKDDTTDVMLEAAYFDPKSIRRTSKSLGVSSESSYRFERGTDVEGLIYAHDRAAELMARLGGGKVLKGRVDVYPSAIAKRSVKLRFARLNKILGITVAPEEAESILSGLSMPADKKEHDGLTVSIPHFRPDLEREIDLIEEVARHVGYGRIIASIPQVAVSGEGVSRGLEMRIAARRHLRSIGMMEGVRLSFVSLADLDKLKLPQDHSMRSVVPLDNPLSSEWTHLRPSLIAGLISPMRGAEDGQIFEIGKVFVDKGPGAAPLEWWSLGGIITGTVKPGLYTGRAGVRDFYHIKGIVESTLSFLGYDGAFQLSASAHPFYYPKRQADIVVGDQIVGCMGQIHPDVLESYESSRELFVFELNLDALALIAPTAKIYKQLPKFPSMKRDVAVVVEEKTTVAEMTAAIKAHGGAAVRDVTLFDIFRGEKIGAGKKSAAFSMEFRDDEKTLTDEEADKIFAAILSGLEKDCGAQLR